MYDFSITLTPMSSGAQNRLEEIAKDRHCLIQNIGQGVQQAHVYDRNNTRDERVMRCLEWNWGMAKGSLNLDTSRNVLFLGTCLYQLYKQGKWALLPEAWIIRAYFGKSGILPFGRSEFPIIASATFKYRFIPIQDMENFWVTRQMNHPPTLDGFSNHLHPFDTLPVITSHVHPTFAILHLGSVLCNSMERVKLDYVRKNYPLVDDIVDLYACWTVFPPTWAERDPTYIEAAVNQEDEDNASASDDDSICTPPRRIKALPSKKRTYCDQSVQTGCATPGPVAGAMLPGLGEDFSPSSSQSDPTVSSRKRTFDSDDSYGSHRSKRRAIDDECPSMPRTSEGGQSGWTTFEISQWAQDCTNSPDDDQSSHS